MSTCLTQYAGVASLRDSFRFVASTRHLRAGLAHAAPFGAEAFRPSRNSPVSRKPVLQCDHGFSREGQR
jgi:hypothetical protein